MDMQFKREKEQRPGACISVRMEKDGIAIPSRLLTKWSKLYLIRRPARFPGSLPVPYTEANDTRIPTEPISARREQSTLR